MLNPSSKTDKPKVLYVDDEPENLHSFKALFRRDYDIRLAGSAQEALRIMRSEDIHVLVTDQRMPEMSGSDLLEAAASEFPEVLRYLLTGYSDFDPLVDAINKGKVQGYFSKPLDPQIFSERIHRGLEICLLRERNDQLLAELKESQERLRQAHRLAHIGVWNWNRVSNALTWSEELGGIVGHDPGRAVPTLEDFCAMFVPESRERLRAAMDAALTSALSYQLELELVRPDGGTRWVNIIGGPASDHAGQVNGLHGTVQDVTIRRLAEMETLRARQAVEAANLTKSEFLGNMSHEIRTPLSGIFGVLQLLQTASLDDKLQRFVNMAARSANRLTALLSDVLVLSEMQSGAPRVQGVEFDVRELHRTIKELFSLACEEKGLSLSFSMDASVPPRLVGDETRIRLILFNLVGNALKYTEQGTVGVQTTFLSSGGDRLLFSVMDTGIGIPDEKLRDIFESFKQIEGGYARKYEGAGLGLAVVRRLVDLLGGNISIDSKQGRGTSVYVALPVRRARK